MSHSATITVTNNDATNDVVKYRSVAVTIDHAALVTAKRSRPDGADIRIRYAGRELNCWVDPETVNTTTCKVYFCVQALIEAGGGSDDGYELRWNNLDRQPHAVPRVAHSQMQTWLGDGAVGTPTGSVDYDGDLVLPEDERLKRPFYQFDDQRHRYNTVTGEHDAVAMMGSHDVQVYGATTTAIYGDPNTQFGRGLFIDQAATGFFAMFRNDSALAVKRRLAGYFFSNGAIPSFIGGPTWEDSLFAIVTGGSFVGTSSIVSYAPSPVLRGSDVDAHPVGVYLAFTFSVDPVSSPGNIIWRYQVPSANIDISWTDVGGSVLSARFAAFLVAASTATPAVAFSGVRDFRMEIWDGVEDADIDVSVTIPALSLPYPPGFPWESEYQYKSPRVTYAEFPITGVGRRADAGVATHTLNWNNMDPEDWWELRAVWRADKGGCSTWDLTQPHESPSSAEVRLIPGSLQTSKFSAMGYQASLQVKQERIQTP